MNAITHIGTVRDQGDIMNTTTQTVTVSDPRWQTEAQHAFQNAFPGTYWVPVTAAGQPVWNRAASAPIHAGNLCVDVASGATEGGAA